MLLAVTVLTSIDAETLASTGVAASPADQVLRLARLALAAGPGWSGVQPPGSGVLRAALGPAPFLVVPGVRPPGSAAGDQARTATPAEAVAAGGMDRGRSPHYRYAGPGSGRRRHRGRL
jgi:orotidine-5'-phosphate decarboxylase